MPSTCLVTGGAGFIGCALSAPLVQRFDRVVALDNLHPQVHAHPTRPALLHPEVELVVGDVADVTVWDSLLADTHPQVIIHLAAETGTGQSLLESTAHARTNVVGTTQMLDALARHEVLPETIVFTSSRAIYGEGLWMDSNNQPHYPGMRTHEMLASGVWEFPGLTPTAQRSDRVIPHPTNVYAATKLAQENLLASWCGSLGVNLVSFRLQNVYGVGQSLTNPYTGIVSMFTRWAKAGKTIPVFEDGRIIRDFVYIDDTVSAILAGLEHGGTNRHPFDVGTGKATTVMDLARVAATHYHAPEPQVTGEFREGDIRAGWADISDTVAQLGWQPQVDLAEGISRLCAWIDREAPHE